MKHSVYSMMFGPDHSPTQIVDRLAALGYQGVEWRVHPEWHLSPKGILAEAPRFAELAASRGLETVALAGYLSASDTELLPEVFAAAAILKADNVRVSVARYDRSHPYGELLKEQAKALRAVERLAARHGVKASLEIHFGTIIPNAGLARRLVDGLDPRHVGITFDPGNMVIEGMENWKLSLEVLGEYLAHVHVKNAAWFPKPEGGWRWEVHPMRSGIVDWQQVVSDLKAVGYDGWLSMEDFASLPVEERLSDGIAYLRELESNLR